MEKYIKVTEIIELIDNKDEKIEEYFKKDEIASVYQLVSTNALCTIKETIVSQYKDTADYIKVSEVLKLISDEKKNIDEKYNKGKISITLYITAIGTLEVIKRNIVS